MKTSAAVNSLLIIFSIWLTSNLTASDNPALSVRGLPLKSRGSELVISEVSRKESARVLGNWPKTYWVYSVGPNWVAIRASGSIDIYSRTTVVQDINGKKPQERLGFVTRGTITAIQKKDKRLYPLDYLSFEWSDPDTLRIITDEDGIGVRRYDFEMKTGELHSVEGAGISRIDGIHGEIITKGLRETETGSSGMKETKKHDTQ